LEFASYANLPTISEIKLQYATKCFMLAANLEHRRNLP